MTGALNAIGAEPPKPIPMVPDSPAGMTSVLSAIGAKPSEDKGDNSRYVAIYSVSVYTVLIPLVPNVSDSIIFLAVMCNIGSIKHH